MDYEKAYKEALERARKIHDEIVNNEVIGFPGQITDIFPELRESEDERIRAVILKLVLGMRDEIFTTVDKLVTKPKVLTWLEKQKELPFVKDVILGYPGLYFYDGERMHFRGNPVTEDNPYDFAMSQQKEQKPERINVTEMVAKYRATDEYVEGEYIGKPVNCMIRAYEQGIRDTLLKVKEQKPIESYYQEYNADDYEVVMDGNVTGLRRKDQKPTLNWRTIEQATTKRTDEGDCVTTERMLIKGLIDDEDYRIIDKDVMVNKNLLCIPVSELNAEEQKSCDDLDSEIKRFFDECIIVHEAEIYGCKEDVIEVSDYELIARHFANWQKEQKSTEDNIYPDTLDKAIKLFYYKTYNDGKDSPEWLSYSKFATICKEIVNDYGKPVEWSEYDKATLEYIIEDINDLLDCADDEEEEDVYERELNLLRCIRESTKLLRYTNPSIEWSEDDKKMLDSIIKDYESAQKSFCGYTGKIDFLKSLRPQSKQEWKHYIWAYNLRFNEDALVIYEDNGECEFVRQGNKPRRNVSGTYILIKDIYPQPHWKPSKEQMQCLESLPSLLRNFKLDTTAQMIEEIHDKLKKL